MGQSFEVWGGDQLRDYTYVDDCVNALQLATKNETAVGQIYNLGGFGKPVSLIETAETLVAAAQDLDLKITSEPFLIREYPETRKKIDIGDFTLTTKKYEISWDGNLRYPYVKACGELWLTTLTT